MTHKILKIKTKHIKTEHCPDHRHHGCNYFQKPHLQMEDF